MLTQEDWNILSSGKRQFCPLLESLCLLTFQFDDVPLHESAFEFGVHGQGQLQEMD